jgi:tetraacyldisaccharide 4'-kinase
MKSCLYKLATDESRGPLAGIAKFFLFLFSLVYGLIVRISIFSNRLWQKRLACKVVSVGNITLGGTGKTVFAEHIARYLKQQGHRVAILTRGYKRKITSYERTSVRAYENMGDEPYMLQQKLRDVPVIVDADRSCAAKIALNDFACDAVILDDGFQQWRIKKDLEIVLIDAANPFGNRNMLPRGILREPLSSLGRADIFVLTKADLDPSGSAPLKEFLRRLNSKAVIFESVHRPLGFYRTGKPDALQGMDYLKGQTVTLFSGIGDPRSFEDLIKKAGISVGLSFRFQDHHRYSEPDLQKIFEDSRRKDIKIMVTTEKDAVRIPDMQYAISDMQILVLRIGLMLKEEEKFNERLLSIYSL